MPVPYYNSMNLDAFLALFFPRACLSCSRGIARGVLCEPCRRTITIARTLFCGACHARLFGGKNLCHPDFPYLLGAAGRYENTALRSLVHALKFRGVRSAAAPLAALLCEYADSLGAVFGEAVVVPIPLSRRRFRERGFNQSELFAAPLAGHLGFPLDIRSLGRKRHTKPQSEMKSAAGRRENLHGCFLVRRPDAFAGRNVILVDDVTTTGTTFLEAARAARRAGAGAVFALAAAQA